MNFLSRPEPQCEGKTSGRALLAIVIFLGILFLMSTAEKVYQKTQVLPEPAQKAVLDFVEKLGGENPTARPAPKAGSAKGLVQVAADFDEPLEDFKPYTE